MWRCSQASSAASYPCRMRTGLRFPSAAWPPSIHREGALSRQAVSAFDISCGVRTLRHGADRRQYRTGEAGTRPSTLAQRAGGRREPPGRIHLDNGELDAMLEGGAGGLWSAASGCPRTSIASRNTAAWRARRHPRVGQGAGRSRDEMGTLGSGNHLPSEVPGRRRRRLRSPVGAAFGLAAARSSCRSLRVQGIGPQIGHGVPHRHAVAARLVSASPLLD